MELLGCLGPQRHRTCCLNSHEKSRGWMQDLGEVRIRGPTPGSRFRAKAMVRDLERKDEVQRVTWEENELLGHCSCPHS